MADVYLRPLRLEDAKTSYKWRNDPRIWIHTGSRPTCNVTLEMEEDWIRKVLADGDSRRFAICRKENDEYIGNAYLINVDWKRMSGEEAIFIGDVNAWGKGVGTQARLELQQLVARELGIVEIVSRIRVDNVRSLRSAVKAGLIERKRDAEWIILDKKLETPCGRNRGEGA